MIRALLIGILTVAVISTGYWGYKEHQEKNAVLIRAENNYQRAFHDLTYEMDVLQDKIGTTLAMNSRNSLSPALAEVWRLTSEAHSDVGQLPLTILPFNKTEEFLSQIGDFSYRTAIRDLEKTPLTAEEYKRLQQLYQKSGEIQRELRRVQHLVIKNNLRWMDVELALSSNRRPADNTIIDGFRTVEKNVAAYAETEFGPTATSYEKKEKGFSRLKGEMITEKQAKEIARTFLGLPANTGMRIEKSGKGAENRFYSIQVKQPNQTEETYMDITMKGGYPIFAINNRRIGPQKLSLYEAADTGAQFLKQRKFLNMELYDSSQYDTTASLTFVTNQNGIRIYPESLQMKIALDTGSVVGFSAKNYLSSYRLRTIPKPTLPIAEARKKINPRMKIQETRQAIILNDLKKEVLCYEFLGTFNNDTYQVFINAANGTEEKVQKLQNVEAIYD